MIIGFSIHVILLPIFIVAQFEAPARVCNSAGKGEVSRFDGFAGEGHFGFLLHMEIINQISGFVKGYFALKSEFSQAIFATR